MCAPADRVAGRATPALPSAFRDTVPRTVVPSLTVTFPVGVIEEAPVTLTTAFGAVPYAVSAAVTVVCDAPFAAPTSASTASSAVVVCAVTELLSTSGW